MHHLIRSVERLEGEALHAARPGRETHLAAALTFVLVEKGGNILRAILSVSIHDQHHVGGSEFVDVIQAESNRALMADVAAKMQNIDGIQRSKIAAGKIPRHGIGSGIVDDQDGRAAVRSGE